MTQTTFTVAGGGPVGALLAVVLSRHGYRVRLYEGRPDSRITNIYQGRSINIALSDRGWHSLAEIGDGPDAKKQAIPMYQRAIHDVDGALSSIPYGKEDQAIWSVSRGGINQQLLDDLGEQVRLARPVVQVLHQLPAPPLDFTGRERELAQLSGALEAALEEELGADEPSVIICEAVCRLVDRTPIAPSVRLEIECPGCGTCFELGCPAIDDRDGVAVIDAEVCCGCGLCVQVCPSTAMNQDDHGIVTVDPQKCLGCRYCEWACPYSAPQFDEALGQMTKCDFCREELEQGGVPACVAGCPTDALEFVEATEYLEQRRREAAIPLSPSDRQASSPSPVYLQRKSTRRPMMPTWFGRTYESSSESEAPARGSDAGIDFR